MLRRGDGGLGRGLAAVDRSWAGLARVDEMCMHVEWGAKLAAAGGLPSGSHCPPPPPPALLRKDWGKS